MLLQCAIAETYEVGLGRESINADTMITKLIAGGAFAVKRYRHFGKVGFRNALQEQFKTDTHLFGVTEIVVLEICCFILGSIVRPPFGLCWHESTTFPQTIRNAKILFIAPARDGGSSDGLRQRPRQQKKLQIP